MLIVQALDQSVSVKSNLCFDDFRENCPNVLIIPNLPQLSASKYIYMYYNC